MNEYMKEALKEAHKAQKHNDIPIGAVVVYQNKIIGRGYNKRYKKTDVTNHAEIIAIRQAAKKIKDWRLNECDIYVTLKPCEMCEMVIRESRIRNVYYLIERQQTKKIYQKTKFEQLNNTEIKQLQEKYTENMTLFFQANCKRKSL